VIVTTRNRNGEVTTGKRAAVRAMLEADPEINDSAIFADLRDQNMNVAMKTITTVRKDYEAERKANNTIRIPGGKGKSKKKLKHHQEPPSRRTPVRWTSEEKADMIRETVNVYLKKPHLGLNHCFTEGQHKALPNSRWRQGHISVLDWVQPAVKKELADRVRLIEAGQETDKIAAAADERIATMRNELDAMLEMNRDDILSKMSLGNIVGYAVTTMMEKNQQSVALMERIEEHLRAGSRPADTNGNDHSNGHTLLNGRKFHLVIIGVVPSQIEPIKRIAGIDEKLIKFSVIDVDCKRKAIPQSADIIIVCQKYSNACCDRTALNDLPHERVIKIDGKKGNSYIGELIRDKLHWINIHARRSV